MFAFLMTAAVLAGTDWQPGDRAVTTHPITQYESIRGCPAFVSLEVYLATCEATDAGDRDGLLEMYNAGQYVFLPDRTDVLVLKSRPELEYPACEVRVLSPGPHAKERLWMSVDNLAPKGTDAQRPAK